jgi:hypothetical protein
MIIGIIDPKIIQDPVERAPGSIVVFGSIRVSGTSADPGKRAERIEYSACLDEFPIRTATPAATA